VVLDKKLKKKYFCPRIHAMIAILDFHLTWKLTIDYPAVSIQSNFWSYNYVIKHCLEGMSSWYFRSTNKPNKVNVNNSWPLTFDLGKLK
jgi:hypothetical protein